MNEKGQILKPGQILGPIESKKFVYLSHQMMVKKQLILFLSRKKGRDPDMNVILAAAWVPLFLPFLFCVS